MSEVDKLIEILSIVSMEPTGSEAAEKACESLDWSKLSEIKAVYVNLFHYWHDEDIRDKDKVYCEMQNSELKKLIVLLENQDYDKANMVSFLTDSES